jgi:hypothetical protein
MARNSTDQARVPLLKVANVLGTTAEALLGREDVLKDVADDWAGRPSLSAAQARAIVTKTEQDRNRAELDWAEFQAYLSDRERRRQEVGSAAFLEGIDRFAEANYFPEVSTPDGGYGRNFARQSPQARDAGNTRKRAALEAEGAVAWRWESGEKRWSLVGERQAA